MSIKVQAIGVILGFEDEIRNWSVDGSNHINTTKEQVNNICNYSSAILLEEERVILYIGGKVVGMIGAARFENNSHGVYSHNHLFKLIHPDYREKGLGEVLIREYINAGFKMPPCEFTTDINVVKLMSKFGYFPDSVIIKGDEDILLGDEDIQQLLDYNGGVIKLTRQWD